MYFSINFNVEAQAQEPSVGTGPETVAWNERGTCSRVQRWQYQRDSARQVGALSVAHCLGNSLHLPKPGSKARADQCRKRSSPPCDLRVPPPGSVREGTGGTGTGGPGAEELEETEVLCSCGPLAMGFSSAVSMLAGRGPRLHCNQRDNPLQRSLCVSERQSLSETQGRVGVPAGSTDSLHRGFLSECAAGPQEYARSKGRFRS